jgi:hypothetical protein
MWLAEGVDHRVPSKPSRTSQSSRSVEGCSVMAAENLSLLSRNADKVDMAIDKAGDVVDRKYKGTVDKVEEEAKKFGIGE